VRFEQRDDGSLAMTYSKSAIAVGDILKALSDSGVQILDVASEEPDLEDVFLSLTSSST
jgi:ABC-2 type transport system ATP-binding protein